MKKIVSVSLVFIFSLLLCSRAYAYKYTYNPIEPMCFDEPQLIRCTCYCEHSVTASGAMPYYGIVAGKKKWMGYVAEIHMVAEDGSVGQLIGYFEFKDTGAGMDSDGDGKGDTIKNGTSIDVWVDTLEEAYMWVGTYGDYVYVKLIKGDG